MPTFSIHSLLVMLVLAVALPLAGLLAYTFHERSVGRTESALALARANANSVRIVVDGTLDEARRLAGELSAADCAAIHGLAPSLFLRYATLALLDPMGRVVCAEGRRPVAPGAIPDRDAALRSMIERRAPALGDPTIGPLTDAWELLVVHPRYKPGGEWAGAVAVAVDIVSLEELLQRQLLDPRDVLGVLAPDGRFLIRSSDTAAFIGRRPADSAVTREVFEKGATEFKRVRGADGREGIGVIQKVGATGWLVAAVIERERIFGALRSQQLAAMAVFAAVLLAAVALGVWLSRTIARPIAALAGAAANPAEPSGTLPHIPLAGPKEVVAVARQLNTAAEARARAEAQVRLAARRAQSFLESSAAIYARVDREGHYQIVSRRWRELFGASDIDMLERSLGEFSQPADAALYREVLHDVVQTATPSTYEREVNTHEGRRVFLATVFPVRDETGIVDAAGALAIDVSEFKAAERERQRLNAILTRVADAVPVCLSYIDADDRYAWTNSRNGTRLGLAPERLIGTPMREVHGDRDWIDRLIAALRRGTPVYDELEYRHPDGALRMYERFLVPDVDAAGAYRGLTTVWLDITERKRAEEREHADAERMRGLSRRLIGAQEAERRVIARELHDEAGQALTAVQATLQSIKSRVTDPTLVGRLEEGTALVNRVIGEIRNASMRLRPTVLDDLGLVPALRWLVDQQRRVADIDIALSLEGLAADVPPETATACFRIVQEAITNAIRHGDAGRVRVRLKEVDRSLECEVEDDGIGFDLPLAQARAARGEGSGISSMRERAELLGGACKIATAPGAGATIRVSLPL